MISTLFQNNFISHVTTALRLYLAILKVACLYYKEVYCYSSTKIIPTLYVLTLLDYAHCRRSFGTNRVHLYIYFLF